MFTQNENGSALVGSLVARSRATVRVAKRVLFRTSSAKPAITIPAIDFRWIVRCVSLQSESAKSSPAVAMRTHVHGWVRKSATERASIAQYFGIEGDLEKSKSSVRKRYAKTSASMFA